MRHIASTDASVTRAEAAAMVTSWFITSTPALSTADTSAAAPGAAAAQVRAARQAGAGATAVLEVGGRSLTKEEKLLANDRCAANCA